MIDEATLSYLKQDKGGKQQEYLKITMDHVYVSSFQVIEEDAANVYTPSRATRGNPGLKSTRRRSDGRP
jgi:type VI protein secretion system component Hcp